LRRRFRQDIKNGKIQKGDFYKMKFENFLLPQIFILCCLLPVKSYAQTSPAATGGTAAPATAGSSTATSGANCGTAPIINILNSVGAAPVPVPVATTVVNKTISDLFKPGQLEKYKLKLGGADGTTLFDMTDPANPAVIGIVIKTDVPFIYEWADTPTHLAWLREHGISSYEMKQDIAAPGQASGKGYYVSSNPIDSIGYGTGLTIFRPGRPMAILIPGPSVVDPVTGTWSVNDFDQFSNDTASVKRLRSAGIDGFQTFKKTWFSIINDSLLKGTSEVDAEYLRDYLKQNSPTDVLNTMITLKTRPWEAKLLEKYFPKDHPLYKLIHQQPLTAAEINSYAEIIVTLPGFSNLSSKEPFFHYLRQSVLAPYLRAKVLSQDIVAFSNVIGLLSRTNLDYKAADDIFTHIPFQPTPLQKNYQQILAANDLSSIASSSDVTALKTSGTQFSLAQNTLHTLKKPTLDDMMNALQKSTGKPVSFRSMDVTTDTLQENYYSFWYLNQNKFLSITSPDATAADWGTNVHVSIEYPSVKNYQNYSPLLSADLLNQLNTMGVAPTADVIAKMNSSISEELVRSLFDPVKRIDAVGLLNGVDSSTLATNTSSIQPTIPALYQSFLSIHPFQDQATNEAMAKLFFQFSDQNVANPAATAISKIQNSLGKDYIAEANKIQQIATAATQKALKLKTPAEQAAATTQALVAQNAANQANQNAYSAAVTAAAQGAMAEAIPDAAKIGYQKGYSISMPAPNFGLVQPDQVPIYLRLQSAISLWVSLATNDQDFISRAQAALNAVVAGNPGMAQAIPALPTH
jgi:hypothetical protein